MPDTVKVANASNELTDAQTAVARLRMEFDLARVKLDQAKDREAAATRALIAAYKSEAATIRP